ncbi:putative globin X [Schistosoma mansoni]|uniref:putative globin X n=1 Tax=Schistosoma mansoni TaxID=6183 RepID=UPI00022DC700|nr:putative globin X [Schistosoma mansoni]|eukprot:XP_018652613.1 putative globin X [Schistosoma mansoni]
MDDQIITVESSQSLDSIILHNSNDKDVKCLDDCVHLNTIKSSSINITYDEGELSTTASLSSSPSLNPTRHELNTSKPLNDSNYSLINSFKKRIKQHLTLSRNSSLYKITFNSSSSSISSTNVNKLNLTQDVPDDITSIQNEHENALNTVTSFTNEQLLLLQTSWSIVKQHIEKIGVITFLGIFEQHSDFRDAFTEFRKRKFVDIKT